ncbi:dipeptide ABC transporter ATP-binding protein [Anaerosporobacter faecicola]|uniref:dipeptide ABC transporter ATP-binding protein n=1 Tax=Anaerosporobacter faecicola TaxID=2718714 RepID=UPI00143B3D7B|nr:ABC transporter ATP-binding protein [Anaerosporobacter faecicola]
MLLEVKNLTIGFVDTKPTQQVVNQISFHINKGEILGIVGESGSGKSMTALSIMGLQKDSARITSGEINLEGKNLLGMSEKERRAYLGKEIAMVFQEPMTSLNPVMKIGDQVSEMLKLHTNLSKQERLEKTYQSFEEVGLSNPKELYDKYPFELSGGMRQRVMIAMAMICKPKVLIADEPTTALDVSVQAQILELLKKMNEEYGVSIILISHDLGVIRTMCKQVIVMAEGNIVEQGQVEDILYHPKQEYTIKLLEAIPSIHRNRMQKQHNKENEKESADKQTVNVQELSNHANGIGNVSTDKMLTVSNLSVSYYKNGRIHRGERKEIVQEASFYINTGEVVGIVGESGSGKSTLAKAIVGLLSTYEGHVQCEEARPQMVFQDPYSSLNQAKRIEWILEEPLKIQGGFKKKERKQLVRERLQEVGLSEEIGKRYIHQLSGGQRQRVCIAAALMLQSRFVVLDEAVSALDVTIQRQILTLLMNLKRKHNLTYLFISHDMNVIHEICDRVLVMHNGRIVEQGETEDVFASPKAAYTKKLLEAVL